MDNNQNQENIQNAINSINALNIPSEKKEALISQLKASIPGEESFRRDCESLVYDLNRYDACALNQTHIRIGTSQEKKPCIYVWYVDENQVTFFTLHYVSWQKLHNEIQYNFRKNLNDYASGGDIDLIGADRAEEQSLDVVEIMQALAHHGATVSTI